MSPVKIVKRRNLEKAHVPKKSRSHFNFKEVLGQESAQDFVNAMLAVSRLSEGGFRFPRDPFILQQVVDSLLSRCGPKLEGHFRCILWLMALKEAPRPKPAPTKETLEEFRQMFSLLKALEDDPKPRKGHDHAVMEFQRHIILQYLTSESYPHKGSTRDRERWIDTQSLTLVSIIGPLTCLCHCDSPDLYPQRGLLVRVLRGERDPSSWVQDWILDWKEAAHQVGYEPLMLAILASLHRIHSGEAVRHQLKRDRHRRRS